MSLYHIKYVGNEKEMKVSFHIDMIIIFTFFDALHVEIQILTGLL